MEAKNGKLHLDNIPDSRSIFDSQDSMLYFIFYFMIINLYNIISG
jgi:hypothetical protein